jgi:hypothetical protein
MEIRSNNVKRLVWRKEDILSERLKYAVENVEA